TFAIRNPIQLSVKTALDLFALKILPIAAYGVRHTWNYLSESDFYTLDTVKAAFIKRTLGISKFSRNRLVYLMADCQPMSVDLQQSLNLPKTEAFLRYFQKEDMKQCCVP